MDIVKRVHGHPEQEAAVQYLIIHWRSFRLEARPLDQPSVDLSDLYDECMGIRTTPVGPGAAFKAKGLPYDLEHLILLVPEHVGNIRQWFDANSGYRCIGTLVKIRTPRP